MAVVTNAGWDAVDATALGVTRDRRAGWRKARERLAACRRTALKRTVKSCGPGAPTLALSFVEMICEVTVAKEPGHRGELEGNR